MSDRSRLTRSDEPLQPRIWRSRENRVIAGVVGGLAERLGVNATMLRWLVVIADVITGFIPGFIIYWIMWGITDVRPPR